MIDYFPTINHYLGMFFFFFFSRGLEQIQVSFQEKRSCRELVKALFQNLPQDCAHCHMCEKDELKNRMLSSSLCSFVSKDAVMCRPWLQAIHKLYQFISILNSCIYRKMLGDSLGEVSRCCFTVVSNCGMLDTTVFGWKLFQGA